MFSHTKLKNNTRVVFVPQHETKALTLLTLFRVGSRFENKKTLGISHFLEHMMFKGTKKRPETIEISRELDGVGAEYNAFTGKDHTGYYIKVNYEHAEFALDIMHDILTNSLLRQEEIERERNVILEEINMYEDNPIMLIDELFEEELYTGNSLGWRIAGDATSLERVDRKEIVSFFKEYYRPTETVFVAAGQIPENLREMVDKTFGSVGARAGGPKQPKPFVKKAAQAAPRVKLKFKDTGQVQLAFGFPSYPFLHPKLPALNILTNILGGTMSSRLFIEVREKRGLAYAVRSGLSLYEDVGNISVQAGLDKSRIDEAIKVMVGEIKKITKEGVSQKELDGAKENIHGRMILALEDSSVMADFFGKQELHTRKIFTPEEKLKEVFAVRKEDVEVVAREIFKLNKLAAAVIGPFEDVERFRKLMKF